MSRQMRRGVAVATLQWHVPAAGRRVYRKVYCLLRVVQATSPAHQGHRLMSRVRTLVR
jgi:hypothetical protein